MNTNSKIHWSAPGKGVLQDEDGTGMNGTPGLYAVAAAYTDFLTGVCTTADSDWGGSSTWFCPAGTKMARVAMYSMSPFASFDQDTLYVSRITDSSARCSDGQCSCGFGVATANCTFTAEGGVPYKNEKWKEPADGWAVPVAVGERYKIAWPNDPDFEDMTVEVSYLMPGEYLYLEYSFLGLPDHYGLWVDGQRVADPSNVTWPATGNSSGTAFIDMDARTLTVLFSGTGNVWEATTTTLRVKKFACPEIDGEEVCPVPPAPPPVEEEDFIRLWSNASMWIERGHTGVPTFTNPGDAVVEIPAEWQVKIDQDFIQLIDLHVFGRLIFDDTLKATWLRVQTLQIWGGEVVAGNSSTPFASSLKIEFWAYPWTPPMQLGSFVNAGTNVLAVLGRLELYGQQRPVRWTRLAATAEPNDVWIYPDNYSSLDWAAGDEVVVASTTHDQFEAEKFTITAVDATAQALLIDNGSFQYKHFGAASAQTVNGQTLDVRAEVGLVSNNIQIVGAAFGVDLYGFGCQVLVTSYGGYSGSAVLSNVQIANCGQRDTTRYALNFLGPSAVNTSSVSGCSISDSLSSGLSIRSASSISVTDTVIYKTIGGSVEIVDSSDITLQVPPCSQCSSLRAVFFLALGAPPCLCLPLRW